MARKTGSRTPLVVRFWLPSAVAASLFVAWALWAIFKGIPDSMMVVTWSGCPDCVIVSPPPNKKYHGQVEISYKSGEPVTFEFRCGQRKVRLREKFYSSLPDGTELYSADIAPCRAP